VSTVVERRNYGKGILQLERRAYRRKDGGLTERGPYWYCRNGTKRKTLYGRTQAEVRVKLTKAPSDRIDGIRATGVEVVARGEGPGR
jgi:hypothetical protein